MQTVVFTSEFSPVYHDSSWNQDLLFRGVITLEKGSKSQHGRYGCTIHLDRHDHKRTPNNPDNFLQHTTYMHTRQSKVILEFPRKNSSSPSKNCRSFFRNLKRFQFQFLLYPITSRAKPREYLLYKLQYSFIHSKHWIDFYSIIRREDRIVPNLDTLLTYAHDGILATAAKQKQPQKVSIFLSTSQILPEIKLRRQPFYQAQMVAIVSFLRVIRMGIYSTTAARGI